MKLRNGMRFIYRKEHIIEPIKQGIGKLQSVVTERQWYSLPCFITMVIRVKIEQFCRCLLLEIALHVDFCKYTEMDIQL